MSLSFIAELSSVYCCLVSMYSSYQSISRENSQVVALENEVFQRAGTTNSQNTQIQPRYQRDMVEQYDNTLCKKIYLLGHVCVVYHDVEDSRCENKAIGASGLRDLQRIFLPHW